MGGFFSTSICLLIAASSADYHVTPEEMRAASVGCHDCHSQSDAATMHPEGAVILGCTHCHGGNAAIRAKGLERATPAYHEAMKRAHILPRFPERWPSSANPEQTFASWLEESPEFVRFVNPGDLRAAPEACGSCHQAEVAAVERSLMTTSAMLWGGGAYNNNILPFKNYILGESYDREGRAREIMAPVDAVSQMRGALSKLMPLPPWEITKPGDVFRVFERGGISNRTTFPEIGNPNPLDESGKPDIRASNRGPGTGSRISVPLINIHKTRLNDPHLSLLGTNDHPGDFRSSGCTACHVVYANNRDRFASGPYARFGHGGQTQTLDPTISKTESGHPLKHQFTRAIPTSQCMVCHMHQPNVFVNSYLGYTMWDYESDAPFMWPKKQKYPSRDEAARILEKNPEEAVIRGQWSDEDFLRKMSELNPKLQNTQFADYHGHGWNFRAVFKKDRKGRLLDAVGKVIDFKDPQKFKKAVHLMDIHLEKGMQCVDCHFSQDSHGDGHLYGEVAQAIEIDCIDCHGTASARANLKATGPAAKEGRSFRYLQTPFGKPRFYWKGSQLYQRASLEEKKEWRVRQVVDSLNPLSADYNPRAARAKLVSRLAPGSTRETRLSLATAQSHPTALAHANEKISCFACHSSWMTSCAGCHLPIQANWKQPLKHYETRVTRNWATYNPQVVRDDVFQLGLHGPSKGGKIVPVRSSSALVLSSTDINRQKIYIQQPPTAASGHSSQAFAPHFPHTVRTKETKTCSDCHLSEANDNNAILSQLFLFGTQFMNFMGYFAYVATGEEGFEAIQVTEWDEPQAVIGSYLHRYAYPDYFKEHEKRHGELQNTVRHHGSGGETLALQMRGEYLHTVAGSGGYVVYDIANVANKGFSEKIVTAPVSPLGQRTYVKTKNARSLALPTTMPVAPFRNQLPANQETPLHAIYHYALIADAEEGLILVNIDTLQDGDPENNFLERALTWNEKGLLTGAQFVMTAGSLVYVLTHSAMITLDLDEPLKPKVVASLPFKNPKSLQIQFRYAFVVDDDGMHSVDITFKETPRRVASLPMKEAQSIYVARTYAYVAGGHEGLVIVDIEKPEKPFVVETFTGEGRLKSVSDVKVATTNASLLAYVADRLTGFWVLQLTDPERVPAFYGFSPEVKPKIIAHRETQGPALAISKPLDRDRAVDESGHQVSVFGRLGSRPFTREEIERFFLTHDKKIYRVKD